MDYLRVKNFDQFQHYKDRNPPWIKLYTTTADDYLFSSLPDATKAHLILIWLLASKTGNKLPNARVKMLQSFLTCCLVNIENLLSA